MIDRLIGAFLAIQWIEVGIAAGILAVFLLFRKWFTRYLFAFIMRLMKKSSTASAWLLAFEKPMRAFFVVMGVYLSLNYLAPASWPIVPVMDRMFRSAIIILFGSGIYNLSASSSSFLEGISRRFGLDDSSMLIPFLSKIVRFFVFLIIVTAVGAEWGFSINGVVAGMGLGSLAVALAAKETLGNILGGIVIILEKPFSKNDWIMTPTVEGVVEDITFRSTRIRTFADSVVTVPNAMLSDQAITNWSRMGKRQISFSLGVALNSDPQRLQAAVKRIEDELKENSGIDQGTIMVRFRDFHESSLGIFFYFFTKTTVWSEYLTVRQETNLMIMRVFEEEGIRLAYPAQRVFVQQETEAALEKEKHKQEMYAQ